MTDLVIPKDDARVTPRLPEQVNPDMQVEYEKARIRWGIPDNLIRTMGCHPQLTLTEIDYINSVAFDTGSFVTIPDPSQPNKQVLFPASGFVDRITKELCISLVSLLNRSRYSITHHTMIGFSTLSSLVEGKDSTAKAKRAEQMLLCLVNEQCDPTFENQTFEDKPLYTPLQTASLQLAFKLNYDERSVTDEEIEMLRELYTEYATDFIQTSPLGKQFEGNQIDPKYVALFVDAMLVEISWCICHFSGLLNKWFTFMKMTDETYPVIPTGENFIECYNKTVPESIKKRNNALLGPDGWGNQANTIKRSA